MKRRLLMLIVSLLAVAALTSVSMAADTQAAEPTPPVHAKRVAAPKTTMGEVTAVTPGKHFVVKDDKGKIHKFSIGKKTKIDGELKVGAKVNVTSKGRWAEEVKVEGGAAPTASSPAPEKY